MFAVCQKYYILDENTTLGLQVGWAQNAALKIIFEAASYKRNFRKFDQKAFQERMRLAKTHCIQVLNI